MRRSYLQILGLCGATALVAAGALAHPILDERLERLGAEIAGRPGDATLLLTRGALLLDEGHHLEAIEDLDRALALDPDSRARLVRGRAWLELGEPTRALADAHGHLRRIPDDPEGWLLVARAECAAGRPAAALAPYQEFFSRVSATPELYLERAAAFREAGDLDGAANGLEEGVRRVGPLTSLLVAQLGIADERDDLEGALAVLRRLLDVSPRAETWLVERARRLADAGRIEAAENDLLAAARHLAARPRAQRRAPAWAQAEVELRKVAAGLPGVDAIVATLGPAP